MNKYIGLLLLVVFASCKTAKPAVAEGSTNVDKKVVPNAVIEGHYANKRDFSTAYIKANVRYEDAKNKQNVSAEIRIKKDEMILVSIRVLGITMAKALITPTDVKYYEKINGEYFEGDYAALTRFLGMDLDFQKVQNLLIGQAMDDLRNGNYITSTEDNLYKLVSEGSAIKEFLFEPNKFWLKKQRIEQPSKQRSMQVFYPDYVTYGTTLLPTGLQIEATQLKGTTTIQVEINGVEIDQPLTFPYSVPGGYERIYIND